MTPNDAPRFGEVSSAMQGLLELEPNSTMARAYLLMRRLGCIALPVSSRGEIVGVILLSDIEKLASKHFPQVISYDKFKVAQHMKSPVKLVQSSQGLSEVISEMLSSNIQAVVLVEEGLTLGALSRDNLLEILIKISEISKSKVIDSFKLLMQSPIAK